MHLRRFFAWFLISLFYALQYILRVIPNSFSTAIMERFDVGVFSVGQFSALYYVGYTAAHIPLGILIDRYGLKKVVPACIAMTFIGVVPIMLDSWVLVQVGRVLTGVGSAAAALAIFKVSAMCFEKKFARMASISVIIGLLGAMYGGVPALALSESWGVTGVFLAIIAVGFVLAVASAFVFFDSGFSEFGGSVYTQVKAVLCNKWILVVSILGGFMIGPLEGFADGWATVFLSEVCGIAWKSAATLSSTVFMGACSGSFAISYLLDKSYCGWRIMIGCGICSLLVFLALLTGNCSSEVSAFVLLLVMGFCTAYQVVALCKSIKYAGGGECVALATAASNMIIMFFGYLFHTVIALVIDMNWDGKISDGHTVYGHEALVQSMLIIPVGLLIGILGFVITKRVEQRNAPSSR